MTLPPDLAGSPPPPTPPVPPVVPGVAATPPAPPAPPPPPPPPVVFPITWLLDHASPPIQYRAMVDVAGLTPEVAERARAGAYSFPPAMLLALTQGGDGSWHQSMFGVPSQRAAHFEGVGTMLAVRRLLEYGWQPDSPPMVHARRLLFRLLAEDDDPQYLFELQPAKGSTYELRQRGRLMLREAAASLLAQAGYGHDPRLRGAARRAVMRVADYLASPLAAKPWVRNANKQVLAAEAAPPSLWLLWMLAFMPHFRNEHHEQMELLYTHLTQPLPRQEAVQQVGDRLVEQEHLVLGDWLPHRNAADADVPRALAWLELMARLGFLKRNENWLKLFDRFLDDRDAQGVWHPHKGLAAPRTTDRHTWGMFPLDAMGGGDERWTDVTFRLGLIAKLIGRQVDLT